MYRNINNIIESIRYRVEESKENFEDVIIEVIDFEVSCNNWYLNHQIIEQDYNSDIITAIIKYKNEYGELDINDENDKFNIYSKLAFTYIYDEAYKEWNDYLEEKDAEEEEEEQ